MEKLKRGYVILIRRFFHGSTLIKYMSKLRPFTQTESIGKAKRMTLEEIREVSRGLLDRPEDEKDENEGTYIAEIKKGRGFLYAEEVEEETEREMKEIDQQYEKRLIGKKCVRKPFKEARDLVHEASKGALTLLRKGYAGTRERANIRCNRGHGIITMIPDKIIHRKHRCRKCYLETCTLSKEEAGERISLKSKGNVRLIEFTSTEKPATTECLKHGRHVWNKYNYALASTYACPWCVSPRYAPKIAEDVAADILAGYRSKYDTPGKEDTTIKILEKVFSTIRRLDIKRPIKINTLPGEGVRELRAMRDAGLSLDLKNSIGHEWNKLTNDVINIVLHKFGMSDMPMRKGDVFKWAREQTGNDFDYSHFDVCGCLGSTMLDSINHFTGVSPAGRMIFVTVQNSEKGRGCNMGVKFESGRMPVKNAEQFFFEAYKGMKGRPMETYGFLTTGPN